jgi:hypothetical protein
MITVTPSRIRARTFMGRERPRPPAERLLVAIGVAPALAESICGDLAEEYAERCARHGVGAARWWYAVEALRSAPHLTTHAIRHGNAGQRARLAAVAAGIAVLPVVAVIAISGADGAPARLVASAGVSAEGIVVNSVRPVKLRMQALDAAGHLLPDTGVRYRWTAGTPVSVTAAGVITCTRAGDAMVHASLGAASTNLRLRCRPVNRVRAPAMLDLVAGDPAEDVPFEAVDSAGRPVTLLAGQIAVGDSTIVTLVGSRMRARRQGSTWVSARIGDRASFTSAHVYERVATPEGIRPGEHMAVAVEVAGGEMRQWRLPAGIYFLAILPESAAKGRPQLAVVDANCVRRIGHLWCVLRKESSVIAYFPQNADQSEMRRGTLVVWRQADP